MVSNSNHSAKLKKIKRLKRSGYSEGELYDIAVINERDNVKEIMSSSDFPTSSDSDNDSEDCDNEEQEAYDYISLFQVFMNYLFPRAFRTQPVHRWIRSAHSVSDLRERSTGKILSPVGQCSLFPQGVFVQSTAENDVTKISFPGAEETFTASSSLGRNRKQAL